MPATLRVSTLIPSGLIVNSVTRSDDTIFVTARGRPGGDVSSVRFALAARSQPLRNAFLTRGHQVKAM